MRFDARAWRSSHAPARRRSRRRPAPAVFGLAGVVLSVLGATAASARAQAITRDEALAAAFPGATIRAERVFLTRAQLDEAAALAGVDIPSALVARYVALRDDRTVGRAYVDTHVVRTKRETLLVSLDAQGRVVRVEVTAFLEPPEYRAPAAWLGQYRGRALDDDLRLQRAIRPLAGATLTARAATDAVRRVLAIDRVLEGSAGKVRR
jgi:electron transport complex protein RnfG